MTQSKTPLIVHVDDRESNRYTVRHFLERSGFCIHQAENGAEGYKLVLALKPDLIILDIKLPDITGYELCRKIKSNPKTSSIPILQVSAHLTDTEARVMGLESGADAYLTSINPDELLATIRALLRAKAAEEAALTVAAEWDATFSSVSDPIVLLDLNGNVKKMNQSAQVLVASLGLKEREELFGAIAQNCHFIAGEKQNSVAELEAGNRTYRLSYDKVSAETKLTFAYVCVLADITEVKKAETEIRRINDELITARDAAIRANRAKSAFLASMSHELRTPLNAIMGYTDIIRDDLNAGAPENCLADLDHISSSAEHLLTLVTELLDLSRIEAGRSNISSDNFDVLMLCEDVIDSIRPLATRRGNTLMSTVGENLGAIWTDAAKLRQILLNLLSNSCKFTSHGQIKLEIDRFIDNAKDVVRFTVSDTGIGIARDSLETIFEAYHQGVPEIERNYGGTGLGLAISKRLAKILGGDLTVASEIGQGSAFSLTVLANIEDLNR